MLTHINHYFCPEKLEQAIKLLEKGKGEFVPLAGGTSLLLYKNEKIKGFISLRKLKLDYIIKSKTGLKVGAMTKIEDILQHPVSRAFARGLLYKACEKIGSTLNRNLITVGGNMVQTYIWSDLPVALLVLETKVKTRKKRSTRSYPIHEFFKTHPKSWLGKDELVLEMEIKNPPKSVSCEFIKFSRTQVDRSLLDIAVYLDIKNNLFREVRIAYGGLKSLPFRAGELEIFLKNKKATPSTIMSCAQKAARLYPPSEDFRASKDYKENLVRVLTERALKNALLK
ncbi:MAG: FAD binding domain-containing protein [Spirochaetes bacterium]|nr:FAD binding domain-containing protein [Spirochaetota bacterium]